MTTPADHHITLMLISGQRIETSVAYLQPHAEWQPGQEVEVHIVCDVLLDGNWYPALYSTGDQLFGGKFKRRTVELVSAHSYLLKGTFERSPTALPPE